MPRVASDAAAHIGRRIADRRQSLGMTQDQVAVISEIDSSNVRAYESGRAMPSIQSLVRIAIALGVEPGELLRGLTLELFSAPAEDGRRRRAN
ncbi:MAG TPA: helix-turn-helix transcriptional regulator [Microbacteriaceae bacterium]